MMRSMLVAKANGENFLPDGGHVVEPDESARATSWPKRPNRQVTGSVNVNVSKHLFLPIQASMQPRSFQNKTWLAVFTNLSILVT